MRGYGNGFRRKLKRMFWYRVRQFEEFKKVLRRSSTNFFGRHFAKFSDAAGDFFYKYRLITLTAVRDRGEIGRVGFDQKSIQRNKLCGSADILRLGKGNVPGKRNHEAQIQGASHVLDASGETVK